MDDKKRKDEEEEIHDSDEPTVQPFDPAPGETPGPGKEPPPPPPPDEGT